MSKFLILIFLLTGLIFFHSCHDPQDKKINCEVNFKKARDLAYENPSDSFKLDSALMLINQSMICDSIKIAVADFKILLLTTLRKYDEGVKFTDSLQPSDFSFPYKKSLYHDNFIALKYASNGDTLSHDNMYIKMANDLEKYIMSSNLNSKEFKDAYTELHILQSKFLDSSTLHRKIDSVKFKYPAEERFLDFFNN